MKFGEYLRKVRAEKGLSLREAARRSDVSHPYLSQLETSSKDIQPTKDMINKIAKGLGVPNGDLLIKAGYIADPFDEIDKGRITSTLDIDARYLLIVKEQAYYNGKLLTKEQREQAVTILDALFKEN